MGNNRSSRNSSHSFNDEDKSLPRRAETDSNTWKKLPSSASKRNKRKQKTSTASPDVAQAVSKLGGDLSSRSASRRSTDYRDVSAFELESGQVAQIQRLYTQISRCQGPSFPGSMIFEHIFVKAPAAKALFSNPGSKGHLHHYVKFSSTLCHVIKNLDDLNSVSERMLELGRKHVDLRGIGFQPKLWDTFAESMIQCTLLWGSRNKRNDVTQEAWTKIVLFIINRMRTGYYQKLRALSNASSTLTLNTIEQPSINVNNGEAGGSETRPMSSSFSVSPNTSRAKMRNNSTLSDDGRRKSEMITTLMDNSEFHGRDNKSRSSGERYLRVLDPMMGRNRSLAGSECGAEDDSVYGAPRSCSVDVAAMHRR